MRQILPLVGLFYLAGHLVQIHGLTYPVSVKSVFSQSSDVKYRMVAELNPREAIQPVAGQLSLIGQDGADMVLVPAGEFPMGSDDGDAKENEKPAHRVYLDAFYIDKYEVTNALYEKFVQATGGRRPGVWDDSRYNAPTQPVGRVTWNMADAYCRWAGKRLPTEAEWEKAARGTDGRKYPWGNTWDKSRANIWDGDSAKPASVGRYEAGKSPYGAYDMAGNVWEWVADWYDADYYKNSPRLNPKGLENGTSRVVRGGSWLNDPGVVRVSLRGNYFPDESLVLNFGMRCARTR